MLGAFYNKLSEMQARKMQAHVRLSHIYLFLRVIDLISEAYNTYLVNKFAFFTAYM